ncbi:hypothetical protein AQ476_27900 [Burkholderia thailandensis]|nr:hypothetical protein AQ476_27900 [Burkholderia thailandensis]PNE78916.1 hypothetical protein A8H37_12705 [Burkholderia thailandensis]
MRTAMRKVVPSVKHRALDEQMFIVCDWLASFALFLLPVFFLLFNAVLFCIWYFGAESWWLMTVTTSLIISMSIAAGAFAFAASGASFDSETFGIPEDCLPVMHCDPRSCRQNEDALARREEKPVRFVRMTTTPCSLRHHSAEAFGVRCFNVDCKGPDAS